MKLLYGIGLGFLFSSMMVGMFYIVLKLAELSGFKMQISFCVLQIILLIIGSCLCLYALWRK